MAGDPRNDAVVGTLRAFRLACLAADHAMTLHKAKAPEAHQEAAVDAATGALMAAVAAALILDAAMTAEGALRAEFAAIERADRSAVN